MVEEPIDPGSLAAILAADYPLIDPPLILAILSDYPPSSLSSSIPAVRDQLGILEATLVPDPDQPEEASEPAESWTESTSLSGVDELSQRLDGLNTSNASGSGTAFTSLPTSSRGSDTDKSEENEEYGDEAELLRSLFPATPEEDLVLALHSYATLQDAIDHLLSLELIKSVEEKGQWPEDEVKVFSEPEEGFKQWQPKISKKPKAKSKASSRASSKPPSIESSPIIPAAPQFNNVVVPSAVSPASIPTKKKKKKDQVTIALVDTLQRKPSPAPRSPRPMSRPASASASRSNSPARISRSGPTNNPWHTLTSLASYLSDLIPAQPQTYFLTFMHSPEYHSAYSAVLASLAKLPKTTTQDGDARKILEDIYGISLLEEIDNKSRRDLERDLEICVHASGEDISIVMDLMDLLGEIAEWPGDDDYDLFEKAEPDYTINTNSITHPAKPQTISLHLPQGAIDMARSTSAGSTISTISTRSVDEAPTGTAVAKLPGKLSRPEKKNKHLIVEDEPHLTGGAIREAKIRQVPGSKPSLTSVTHPTALDHFGIQSPIPSATKFNPEKNKQFHPQNWRTVSHARPISSSSSTPGKTVMGVGVVEKKLTVEQCMANAQLERARRESAIRAAGRSFRPHTTGIAGGGRAVKGAIAGHYAQQAQEAANRAKEWELKATRIVVSSHLNSYKNENDRAARGRSGSAYSGNAPSAGPSVRDRDRTIDLHHLTIDQAKTIVNELIGQWWITEKELRSQVGKNKEGVGKFNIVTGVGRHSANGKGVLGPAVTRELESQGWMVDRGDSERGFLVVRGKRA
ncbi:uncharacterized protein I303_105266 [Kwoniella dejecticola CBS 10117]|uniref:Smr domain-containing protein n=1 Tax=Kwoniella dejecticola CBS 10117 TaxID=1296121 RepID=A0AAJ8KQY3_9TREE